MAENDFEDFKRRFDELALEAREYGIQPVVLLYMEDPIQRMQAFFQGINYGPKMTATGMLQRALHNALKD